MCVNRRFVNESWANHECVQHSSLAKNDISCERRHFCENHELFYHLLLNFSYVRILFQTNVDLNFEKFYVDFRLYRVRFNLDRDYHVKLLWIFDEVNQLVFNRDEQEFVSNRSIFAKLVYSFQSFAIFIRVFVVNQNVHIVCVFQKFRINFEFIAHLQQIDIVEQIENEKQRKSLKSFCSHRERSDHFAIHRQNRRALLKKTDHLDDYSFRYSFFFRRSWINRSCEIVSNISITSRLNKMTIRFVLLFHTMYICFVKNFNVDSIDRFLRHLMWKSNNSRYVFLSHTIRLLMIDFMILLMKFKRIMNRYVFEMM
jgi:hypothetical protein